MKNNKWFYFGVCFLTLQVACSHKTSEPGNTQITPSTIQPSYQFAYVPPSHTSLPGPLSIKTKSGIETLTSVLDFPAQGPNINQWIKKEYPDNAVVRAHSWNIWGALTHLSAYPIQNPLGADIGARYLPAYMTWYSSFEIYGVNTRATNRCSATQQPVIDLHGIKRCRDVSVLAFNKLSLPESKYIVTNRLNEFATLKARPKTPIDLPPFNASGFDKNTSDNVSFSLKPVYYLLKNNAYNLLPYWGGMQPGTTSNVNEPVPTSWRQCVLIKVGNPVGTLPRVCNPGKGNANVPMPAQGWETVSLTDFLSVPLTQAMVDGLKYAQQPNTPIQPSSIISLGYTDDARPQVGDVAVLVAMHVTVRETQDWVWQTMYWSPKGLRVPMNTGYPVFPPRTNAYVAGPNYPGSSFDNPYGQGNNSPGSIPTWAKNYAMCTAYSPVYPVQPRTGGSNKGTFPQICYNPWLETAFDTLPGHFSTTGLNSNCMTCHGQASLQGAMSPATAKCFLPQGYGYYGNGYISRNNTCLTNQNYAYDFSWHLGNAYLTPGTTETANPEVMHQKPPRVAPSFSQ